MPTNPVVDAASSKLSSTGTTLDKILKPLLHRLPTYFSNSNQVIYQLNKTLQEQNPTTNSETKYYLSTVDLVSMRVNMLKD